MPSDFSEFVGAATARQTSILFTRTCIHSPNTDLRAPAAAARAIAHTAAAALCAFPRSVIALARAVQAPLPRESRMRPGWHRDATATTPPSESHGRPHTE